MSSVAIFTTPELMRLVLSNLSIVELTPLLRASRALFTQCALIVWKELKDPLPLFALLDRPSGPKSPRITIPETISPQVWERFELYASCVRSVTNYGCSIASSVEWHGLHHLRGPGPIAPSVRTLGFVWRSEATMPSYWDIIQLLLGPATTSLSCHGHWSNSLSFAQPMNSILERAQAVGSPLLDVTLCPSSPIEEGALRSLESGLRPFNRVSALELSVPVVSGIILDHIRRLPDLRTLCLSTWAADIHPRRSHQNSLEMQPGWTGEPYPRLDSVRLSRVPGPVIERLLNAQPSLLGNVTSLTLKLDSGRSIGSVTSVPSIFSLIASMSRRLQDLTVEWPISMRNTSVILAQDLALLFPLDLRRLTLHRVCLNADSLGIAGVQGTWPRLTHLVMPRQAVWPTGLVQLAKRSNLQVLNVDIKPPRQSDLETMATTRTSTSVSCLRLISGFDLKSTSPELKTKLARQV
ncbi:hypothetical protein FRC09_013316 [Ceratobasidium sp. 395]|nr:hypothetical protein FRC09_013316 [Ceratobasidium sp. 395]